MALGEASVRIVPDTSGFAARVKKEIDDALNGVDQAVKETTDEIGDNFEEAGKEAGKAVKKIENDFKSLGKILVSGAVAKSVVSFAKSSIDAASDLGESINAVQVTFGDLSQEILDFGKTAATTVGLASADFNSFAVRFAGFTKQIASGNKDAADVTKELTTRIADFASVMNLDLNEAAVVFASTLAGESEAIRRFGIDMSAASIEAFALSTGMIKSKDEMTASMKVQATYAKLMADTAQVAGDFANTSDSLANRQRILAAEMKNLQAEVGAALIPTLQSLLGAVQPVLSIFNALPAEVRNTGAVIGISTALIISMGTSLVEMARSAGVSAKAISNLKVGLGLLNTAMIAFSLYQQQEATNSANYAKLLNLVATATDEQIAGMKEQIRIFLDLQDVSPEQAFRDLAESSLGAAQRLVQTGEAQTLFGISTAQATLIIGEQIRQTQIANQNTADTQTVLEGAQQAALGAKAGMVEYVKSLGFIVDESGNVEASQENMAKAVELAQKRYDDAVSALDDYVEALGEVFDATRKSIDTGFAVVDAELEAKKAIDEAKKALKNKKLSAEELDKVMRDSAKTVLAAADAEVAHAQTLAEMRGETLTTAETQQIYIDSLEAFRDTLNPSSPLAQYINGFITTLGEVPTDIPVELIAEVDAAQKELEVFKSAAITVGKQITMGMLEALAPLSPEFKKLLDKMRAEAGKEIAINIKVNYDNSYVVTPYGATPITQPAPAPTTQKTSDPFAGFNWAFADGGIFTQPQVGLFAEAGAEAIIPLTRPARALELMRESGLLGLAQSASGAGQNFDIKVVSAEPMRTAKDVVREFQALEYRMGPL